MVTRRIGILAVTGIASMAAALIPLSATTASAAPMAASAPVHATAQRIPSVPSGCVAQEFGTWDVGTVNRCVLDEQVLLNDLREINDRGPNQTLTVDGAYGSATANDVRAFQAAWGLGVDGITGPQTWGALCVETFDKNFRGVYWHDAGCTTVPGTLRG